jgi:RHS repeat-associated protein
VYYLLGGSREQLAVYHGRETDQPRCFPPAPGVLFYPVEYNSFGIAYTGVMEDIAFVTTKPHAFFVNGTKEYKITDHLSSTRVTLSLTGITSTYDYDPWGKLIASTSGKHRQGYNGREDDRESDLFSLGVRKLDDDNGRMTSVDPLLWKFASQSPYVYSNNDPVNVTDPDGRQGKRVYNVPAYVPYGMTMEPDNGISATATATGKSRIERNQEVISQRLDADFYRSVAEGAVGTGIGMIGTLHSPTSSGGGGSHSDVEPKRIIRFTDEVGSMDLKGVSLKSGRQKLIDAGLEERTTNTGRHEFVDAKGQVRAAYDPIKQQGKDAGHWHKWGIEGGQRYSLNNAGRVVESSSAAAHIPGR